MRKIEFIELESGNYRFEVAGDENATAFVLKNTVNHSVRKKGIPFAEKALTELLEEYNPAIDYTVDEENPVTELSEFIQKYYGNSISSRVISVIDGFVTVEITIPIPECGSFIGIGRNQRLARQEAARKALRKLKWGSH